MTVPGVEQESYLLGFRRIVPSDSLEAFLDAATRHSSGLEIPKTRVFAVESLRIILFERRVQFEPSAQTAEDADPNELLDRLNKRLFGKYVYSEDRVGRPGGGAKTIRKRSPNPILADLKAAEQLHTQFDGTPFARASTIVESSNPVVAQHPFATELALLLDESAIAQGLDAQNAILEQKANNVVARHRLPKGQYGQRRAREIPFMYAEFGGENEKKDYIEMLSTELPVTGLGVDPLVNRLETIPDTD